MTYNNIMRPAKINSITKKGRVRNIFQQLQHAQGSLYSMWCCELDRVSDANVVTLSLYSSVLPTHVYLFKV